jgi:hypothetical protein
VNPWPQPVHGYATAGYSHISLNKSSYCTLAVVAAGMEDIPPLSVLLAVGSFCTRSLGIVAYWMQIYGVCGVLKIPSLKIFNDYWSTLKWSLNQNHIYATSGLRCTNSQLYGGVLIWKEQLYNQINVFDEFLRTKFTWASENWLT